MKEKKYLIIVGFIILAGFCFVKNVFAQQGAVKTLVVDTAKFRTTGGGVSASYKDITAKHFFDCDNNAFLGDPSGESFLSYLEVVEDLELEDTGLGPQALVIDNGNGFTVNLGDTSFGDTFLSHLVAWKFIMLDPGPGYMHEEGNYVWDIAEGITVLSGDMGDVVSISKDKDLSVTRSTIKFDPKVAGVISEDPKIYMGADDKKMPLVLAGIVKCNVNTENGSIKRGDILVTSSEPGYAMKAEGSRVLQGMIVGTSLGSLEQGKGKIEILIN